MHHYKPSPFHFHERLGKQIDICNDEAIRALDKGLIITRKRDPKTEKKLELRADAAKELTEGTITVAAYLAKVRRTTPLGRWRNVPEFLDYDIPIPEEAPPRPDGVDDQAAERDPNACVECQFTRDGPFGSPTSSAVLRCGHQACLQCAQFVTQNGGSPCPLCGQVNDQYIPSRPNN